MQTDFKIIKMWKKYIVVEKNMTLILKVEFKSLEKG